MHALKRKTITTQKAEHDLELQIEKELSAKLQEKLENAENEKEVAVACVVLLFLCLKYNSWYRTDLSQGWKKI